MLRTMTSAAAVLAAFVGTAALAKEHTVLILPEAYFPSTIYVDEGDKIVFVNTSGAEHNIVSSDSEWAVGPIPDQGEEQVVIGAGMDRVFFNADLTDDNGGFVVEGEISFSPPPTN